MGHCHITQSPYTTKKYEYKTSGILTTYTWDLLGWENTMILPETYNKLTSKVTTVFILSQR